MDATKRTTNEEIYQACLNLHNAGKQIKRDRLRQLTGLPFVRIDEHVTRMCEQENPRLRKVGTGVVEIVEVFPPNRPMSKTILPDGTVKAEVGDDVITLTPGEAPVFFAMGIGEATQFSQLRGDRDQADRVARLERELKDAKGLMRKMADSLARMMKNGQQALFGT